MKINKVAPKVRIIGGTFRNKVLKFAPLPHTRPTKALVRKSIFDTIQGEIKGKIFLETFAGFGSVGFEAFSRGAKRVIFIEKDEASFQILKQNIALFRESREFDSRDSRESLLAMLGDSLEIFPKIAQNSDILYFDPPFDENLYKRIFNALDSLDLARKRLIFEHQSSVAMPDFLARLPRVRTRKFGKTSISYYGIIFA